MSAALTHAMILAAGLGTRMRPLTLERPKPLIEVGEKALIDWNVEWLEAAGIENIVINSSYLADQLEAHLAEHPNITISREGEPALETGGGVAKALPHLGPNVFLTMNSDALLLSPAQSTHPAHQLAHAWSDDLDFLMLLVPRAHAHGRSGNGDFVLREDGAFRRPQSGEIADYVFTGVELMHPRVFEAAPQGAFSLGKLWNARAGEGGWFQRMRAVIFDGDWLDVGDLNALVLAEKFLAK